MPCPKALWTKSWEQAALLPWTRYAPPITFIDSGAALQDALQWSGRGKTGCSVLWKIDTAFSGILYRQHDTHDLVIVPKAHKSLGWLKSAPVEEWYMSLTQLQRMYFCTLLHHIASRCLEIGQQDGCFIALNYAVCLLCPFCLDTGLIQCVTLLKCQMLWTPEHVDHGMVGQSRPLLNVASALWS